MRGLRAETEGRVAFQGVGGAAMAAEGLESLFPIADIAVMGLAEVAPKLPTILRRIRETTDALLAAAPDVLITIDAPDFGLRVAERARRSGATALRVHYVAPSVWAWRPGRARKMAKTDGSPPRAFAVRAALFSSRGAVLRFRRPSDRRDGGRYRSETIDRCARSSASPRTPRC